jgi:hypothetical protein
MNRLNYKSFCPKVKQFAAKTLQIKAKTALGDPAHQRAAVQKISPAAGRNSSSRSNGQPSGGVVESLS